MTLTATIHTENAEGEAAITVFGTPSAAGIQIDRAEIDGFRVDLAKHEQDQALAALREEHKKQAASEQQREASR